MRFRSSLILTVAATLALAISPAHAAVIDPLGDFLSTYSGPRNGDLDVVRADAVLTAPGQVLLVGEHAGAIGTTPGSAYVWGIDRGKGIPGLAIGNTPIGDGVTFDAVVALFADGTGFKLDLLAGGGPQALDPSTIAISGNSITVALTEALLPSTGFAFANYRYNLWPRFAPNGVDPTNNGQVSDLAPDNSTFLAAAVPEPSTWAMMIGGIALAGAALRRRRVVFA